MNGWVKIMRQFMDWEWYGDEYMVKFFIHLLLLANHKDGNWKGIPVKKGQLITGLNSLSKSANMTVQKIRTCLNRLKTTGEITIKTTNKYSIITLCNYGTYQIKKTDSNKPTTNKQQTNNNKQEGKEEKEIIMYLNLRAKKQFKNTDGNVKIIRARLNEGYSLDDLKKVVNLKSDQWVDTDMEKYLRPETLFNKTKFQGYINEKQKSNERGLVY